MKRIDTSNRAVNLFSDDKDGFKEAVPGVSEATKLTPDWFNHVQEAICRTIEAANMELSGTDYNQFVTALTTLIQSSAGIKSFGTGVALPSSNVGPLWHDDYSSLMTWQTFNANGADYTGYASTLVGSLLLDTQPIPRTGYIKSGVTNLSRTAYASLRGWAMHNGIMVAEGIWEAGEIAVCDNADGTTFTIYDVRAEFPRFWDDGRGVDSGRVFGSWQENDFKSHAHVLNHGVTSNGSSYSRVVMGGGGSNVGAPVMSNEGGVETRPRNVALLASIKY